MKKKLGGGTIKMPNFQVIHKMRGSPNIAIWPKPYPTLEEAQNYARFLVRADDGVAWAGIHPIVAKSKRVNYLTFYRDAK
mgnify:CR=1 FL=1